MRYMLAQTSLLLLVTLQLASSCSNTREHHRLTMGHRRSTGLRTRTSRQGLVDDSVVCNDAQYFSITGKVNDKEDSSAAQTNHF